MAKVTVPVLKDHALESLPFSEAVTETNSGHFPLELSTTFYKEEDPADIWRIQEPFIHFSSVWL